MRRQTLRATIAKLEKRQRSRRVRRAVVYALFDQPDGAVIGVASIDGSVSHRRWSETLPALCERARAVGERPRAILTAMYAPAPVIAPVAAPGAFCEPTPPPAFDPKRPDAWRDYRAFAEQGERP